MTYQVLELWQKVLGNNLANLLGLYDSLSPYLIILIGVGAVSAVVTIVYKLFRGK